MELGLDPNLKAGDLTEEQATQIANHLQKNYAVEGTLRRAIAGNISRLRDIGCYRGARHRRGLRVVQFENIRGVLLHRHQHVARIDLSQIHESERVLVFVDLRRRNLPGNDLAEHAIAHSLPPTR